MAISRTMRFQVLRRDNHTCQSCGRTPPEVKLQVDHVVPEALGGRTVPENLQALCEDCNGGKSAVPPDAASVARVAEDAQRWAEAQKVAAEQLLANRTVRNDVHRQFVDRWTDWERQLNEDFPFEPGWQRSVDSFVAAGMPIPVLLDCVDRAMRSKKPAADARFRYLCGIAWKVVAELRDATAAIVAGGVPEEAAVTEPIDEASDWAHEVLSGLTEEQRQKALRAATEDWEGAAREPRAQKIAAARDTVDQLWRLVFRVERHLPALFTISPATDFEQDRRNAIDELNEHAQPDEPRLEAEVLVEIARLRAAREARIYLAALPEPEREQWLRCAATHRPHADDNIQAVVAAKYAIEIKDGGGILAGLCAGPGDAGAQCHEKANFNVWLADCRGCEDEGSEQCQGHLLFCETHTIRAIDGKLIRSVDGKPTVVTDYAEVDLSTFDPPF